MKASPVTGLHPLKARRESRGELCGCFRIGRVRYLVWQLPAKKPYRRNLVEVPLKRRVRPMSHPGTLRGLLCASLNTAEPDIGPVGAGDLRHEDFDATSAALVIF